MDGRTQILLVAAVVLIAAMVMCVLGGGAFVLLRSSDAAEIPFAPPVEPSVFGGDTDAPSQPNSSRYRPGPYVEVLGELPTGPRTTSRMTERWRRGHSLNTPWVVAGAELRSARSPESAAGGGGPRLAMGTQTQVPITVLSGTPAELSLNATQGEGADAAVEGIMVAFHDYPGHFYLPASVQTELGPIQVAGIDNTSIHFGLDAAVRPDGTPITGSEPFAVTMYVAVVDLAGRVSNYVTTDLRVMPIGTGDVEVTLQMSEATDLDLYVVDPTGTVIYYANEGGMGTGHLDLDANAACSDNVGVNAEHVFWADGTAPAGTYNVRVANYTSCISGARVEYRVTVHNCGESVVLTGSFEGEGNSTDCTSSPGGDRNYCQNVVEFDVTPCGVPQ